MYWLFQRSGEAEGVSLGCRAVVMMAMVLLVQGGDADQGGDAGLAPACA